MEEDDTKSQSEGNRAKGRDEFRENPADLGRWPHKHILTAHSPLNYWENGMLGLRLGNWIVEEEVRTNEMGRLFRVRSAVMPNYVAALKWLTHPKAKTPEFEKLFLAQIDLLRKLKHPGIVEVLDSGMVEGTPFFAMEWVNGTEFEKLLRKGEKPAWQEVLAIALQIVPALRHAHRRSVLHRDLKPSNLFRCTDGHYKLADFGVTKFFGAALITNADNLLGSASFISPEQAAGKPQTKRSDFYSLGCLLYTLIVGRPPFAGQTIVELIQKHCFVLPERPIHFVRELPEEIDRFVMKLLAKEPAQRPGSGTLLIQDIAGIWSALERRSLIAKRPELLPSADEENDAQPEEEPAIEPRLPEPIPRPPIPWQKCWYIILPAFAACVALLLWGFYGRGPSADDLMTQARPLLESENPADWDKAWKNYLEPMSRKFPDRYAGEVKEAKLRVDEQADLRRAFILGKSALYRSEAERFYFKGLRYIQGGEYGAAKRIWDDLILVYGPIEAEKHWVALTSEALSRVNQRLAAGAPAFPHLNEMVRPQLEMLNRMRRVGKTQEAEQLAHALAFLYRDHPEIDSLRPLLTASKE